MPGTDPILPHPGAQSIQALFEGAGEANCPERHDGNAARCLTWKENACQPAARPGRSSSPNLDGLQQRGTLSYPHRFAARTEPVVAPDPDNPEDDLAGGNRAPKVRPVVSSWLCIGVCRPYVFGIMADRMCRSPGMRSRSPHGWSRQTAGRAGAAAAILRDSRPMAEVSSAPSAAATAMPASAR